MTDASYAAHPIRVFAPARTHPSPIVLAHWLTAAVLLTVYGLALWHDGAAQDILRARLLNAHRLAGLLVGLLAVTRLVLRTRFALATTQAAYPLWQRLLARLMHVSVYLLLLSMPVLGFMLTNARGAAVQLPGLGSLPRLLPTDLDLADSLEDWHAGTAWLLAGVIGLHLLAALWHHFVRRDGVLAAMVPGLRRRH